MSLNRKIGLVSLMALSLITFGAALTKVVVSSMDMVNPSAPGDNDSPCYNGTYSLATGIEQSLVITMGCIPTLGHTAKAMFPRLSGIGSALADVITGSNSWRKQSNGSDSTRSGDTDKSCNDDLKLRPDCHPLDTGDESLGGTTVTAAPMTRWQSDPSVAAGGVRRVDDFTITYETPHFPREDV